MLRLISNIILTYLIKIKDSNNLINIGCVDYSVDHQRIMKEKLK
jgi:hypothetical protein